MKKNQWQFYILALCFLLNSNGLVADTSSAGRQQAGYPFSSGEKLHYKLSYRGLLTSMIWADLADASMTFLADQRAHDGQTAHQFVLSLSTENYAKAEMIQPVRYTYITTLEQDLSKTLLVEEIDVGENRSHDFLWMDWQNNKTQLYKKREKETVSSGFFDVESKQVWEKDGALPLPDFLMTFPLLENNQTYFIHKESGDDIERSWIHCH
jgi:hypothetical protein